MVSAPSLPTSVLLAVLPVMVSVDALPNTISMSVRVSVPLPSSVAVPVVKLTVTPATAAA